jgi:cell division protein FtsB
MSSLYTHAIRLFLLVLLFSLVGIGVFSKRGWLDWRRMVKQNQELQAKIEAARRQKLALEHQVEDLHLRPAEQERVVRQVLGYVKKNETVIEFP